MTDWRQTPETPLPMPLACEIQRYKRFRRVLGVAGAALIGMLMYSYSRFYPGGSPWDIGFGRALLFPLVLGAVIWQLKNTRAEQALTAKFTQLYSAAPPDLSATVAAAERIGNPELAALAKRYRCLQYARSFMAGYTLSFLGLVVLGGILFMNH
jgi:hypothetical protein